MRLTLTIDTDHLRQLIAGAIDSTDAAEEIPSDDCHELTDEILHAIGRQAIAQTHLRTFETDILAALGRSQEPTASWAVHNRATGRTSTVDDHHATQAALRHLIDRGHVARSVHPAAGGERGEFYAITPEGRQALNA